MLFLFGHEIAYGEEIFNLKGAKEFAKIAKARLRKKRILHCFS